MALTVATWNVAGLSSDSPTCGDKTAYLAESLQAVSADIAALLDCNDVPALDALADKLAYDRVDAAPDVHGSRVALLAKRGLVDGMRVIRRWSIPESALVRELDERGDLTTLYRIPRPWLDVELRDGDQEVRVIVAHFHPQAPPTFHEPGSMDVPEAEDLTLRSHVERLVADGLSVIVAGDVGNGQPTIARARPGSIDEAPSLQRFMASLASHGDRTIESPHPLATATVETAPSPGLSHGTSRDEHEHEHGGYDTPERSLRMGRQSTFPVRLHRNRDPR